MNAGLLHTTAEACMSTQTERAFRALARRPTYERLPKTSALVWTVRHHLESSTTCEEARALRATTSRLSERIVQSLSSLGAGMRRFNEAPAAVIAASKASWLFVDRRVATMTRRAPGPIEVRAIR